MNEFYDFIDDIDKVRQSINEAQDKITTRKPMKVVEVETDKIDKETKLPTMKKILVNLDGSPVPDYVNDTDRGIRRDLINMYYNTNPNDNVAIAWGDDPKKPGDQYAQSYYTKQHKINQKLEKDARVKKLMQKINSDKSIVKNIYDNLHDNEIYTCVALMLDSGIRIGGDKDTMAKVKAYGATTLLARHILKNVHTNDKVYVDFIGKGGGHQAHRIVSKEVADELLLLKEKAVNKNDRIFSKKITDNFILGKVKEIFGDDEFINHDIRSLVANQTALKIISQIDDLPNTKKEKDVLVKYVCEQVGKKLGDTPKIAKDSYLWNDIFDIWPINE